MFFGAAGFGVGIGVYVRRGLGERNAGTAAAAV